MYPLSDYSDERVVVVIVPPFRRKKPAQDSGFPFNLLEAGILFLLKVLGQIVRMGVEAVFPSRRRR